MSISERIISEGWAHSTSDPITFQFPLDQVLTKRLNDWRSQRRKIRVIHILWFSLKTNVKTFRFSGMLLLSDWLQDFWDICGGFGLGEGEATFVHLFDRQIKEMWYLCESISLRVWVMDKGNKFSLPPPHALIDIHWTSQISTLVKFVWNLWFSHFPISSSNRFGPIPPLQANPPPLGDSSLLWRFENRPQIFYQTIN